MCLLRGQQGPGRTQRVFISRAVVLKGAQRPLQTGQFAPQQIRDHQTVRGSTLIETAHPGQAP